MSATTSARARRYQGRHRAETVRGRSSLPRSLTLGTSLGRLGGVLAGGALALCAVNLTGGLAQASSDGSETAPIVDAERANAARVDALVREHGCWFDQAPRPGAIPIHAVTSQPGKRAALVPADVGFATWLGDDGVPGSGDERPGTVHAFCR